MKIFFNNLIFVFSGFLCSSQNHTPPSVVSRPAPFIVITFVHQRVARPTSRETTRKKRTKKCTPLSSLSTRKKKEKETERKKEEIHDEVWKMGWVTFSFSVKENKAKRSDLRLGTFAATGSSPAATVKLKQPSVISVFLPLCIG